MKLSPQALNDTHTDTVEKITFLSKMHPDGPEILKFSPAAPPEKAACAAARKNKLNTFRLKVRARGEKLYCLVFWGPGAA